MFSNTIHLFKNVTLFSILFCTAVFSYDGSETWLHYTPVAESMKAGYSAACQSIVISSTESDTLKNAKNELDLAMPGLLGGSELPVADAVTAGAIVLAPEGSPLVASAGIDFSTVNEEGFIIKSSDGATYITGKSEVGVLRGVFHFLRLMQTAKPINNLDIAETPYFAYRVLDHWWNHYGSNPSTERVYGGDRIYLMERFGSLNQEGSERTAVINYCRMAASLGLNGITPDGVNTSTMNSQNWKCLQDENVRNLQVFAENLGTYGLKTFLSVSYASPRSVGGLSSSSPTDQAVVNWWANKVDQIYGYIPNFGGFLIKADSESEFGPASVYGSNQSEGAKPIADALAKHGGTLVWRTFIYSASTSVDFAVTQMETFHNQTWHPNIILRMKDGPRDFQVVEPPNFITTYGGMRHGMELQVTQEYTGQDKHVCWLVPKWKQVLEWNMKGADLREGVEGDKVRQILRGDNTWEKGGGLWGISNFSNAKNWTGHYIHQANAYGYGRLAWNPMLTEDEIANEWVRCSFATGESPTVRYIIKDMLLKSWKTYEDYTISYSALMPAVGQNPHYEIGFDEMRGIQFYTEFFMHLTNDGVGVDRTSNASTFLSFLPQELADSLGNIETCPEDYLLFFHHCKWEYVMNSGMTLIQSLYHNHRRGIRQVKRFINNWKLLDGKIDGEIYAHVLGKLNTQLTDATRWANDFDHDFGPSSNRYSTPVGCDLQIIIPDADKAVTAAVGEAIPLSATFADQFGDPVIETVNWNVDKDGGALDATSGENVGFAATADGVYTVTASTATWPDLKDRVQLFVGDWMATGVNKSVLDKKAMGKMKLNSAIKGVVIYVPFAGTIDILGLNGRVVQSFSAGRAGNYHWNTKSAGAGLYIVQVKDRTRNLQSKVLVK